jgi:hypothetical protein
MQDQAVIQASVYEWVERTRPDPSGPKVILLAPQFGATWNHLPMIPSVGSWVFEWRRPHPDLHDNLLILPDLPGLEPLVREKFPDRRFYRLLLVAGPPFAVIVPLDGPGSGSAIPFGILAGG